MTKELNMEWINELLKDNNKEPNTPATSNIDWVQSNKKFKKNLKIKLLPANSSENNIFGWIVGTHWNLGPDNKRFVCPEQTTHLKKLGIKCPVCEAKRRLRAMGFSEEDLSKQGKFGLIPIFDPTMTSNVKVVVIDSDMVSDWDQAHVSVLQQKGTFLVKWLVERYIDKDTPDLLQYEKSNIIRFSRETENGRWDRDISFATFEPSADVIAKLKEENEALIMPDLWKAPTDQEILEITDVVKQMEEDLKAAKRLMTNTASFSSTISDDDIPF